MTTTLHKTTTLTVMECGECGVTFALDDDYIAERRKDHRTWYCPNGHARHYPQKNETEMLRAQLDQAQAEIGWQQRRRKNAEADAEYARRQSAARKGVITKMKNRITNGICPVPGCKRSGFDDVLMHIAVKHPDFHKHEGET